MTFPPISQTPVRGLHFFPEETTSERCPCRILPTLPVPESSRLEASYSIEHFAINLVSTTLINKSQRSLPGTICFSLLRSRRMTLALPEETSLGHRCLCGTTTQPPLCPIVTTLIDFCKYATFSSQKQTLGHRKSYTPNGAIMGMTSLSRHLLSRSRMGDFVTGSISSFN